MENALFIDGDRHLVGFNLKTNESLLSTSSGLDEDCQVYKLLPKVSRIEIMSCEVSRLCEIEFLDAINNERQALARRKNQTNDQNRAQSGSSGVKSGSNSSIHASVGRFSWLYDELMDRMGDKSDKEFVNKIVTDLNQKWTCEEKHRQQSLNLIIKEMKKQTYSGKDWDPNFG